MTMIIACVVVMVVGLICCTILVAMTIENTQAEKMLRHKHDDAVLARDYELRRIEGETKLELVRSFDRINDWYINTFQVGIKDEDEAMMRVSQRIENTLARLEELMR